MATRALVTGAGAICAAGRSPDEIFAAVVAGRSSIAPIASFDTSGFPSHLAGEIAGVDLRSLLADRKLLKFIRRTDVFGIFAAARAIEDAGATAWRETLADADAIVRFNDRFGCFVGLRRRHVRQPVRLLPADDRGARRPARVR